MKPTRLLRIFLFTLVSLALAHGADAQDSPNILLLIADDYGVDQSRIYTETAGAPTPTIAEIAQRGVTFDQMWATPSCSPTRATMITGQYGIKNGIPWVVQSNNSRSGLSNRLDLPHLLPRQLQQEGYDTGLIGKWHLSGGGIDHPIHAGFDFWSGTVGSFGAGDGQSPNTVAAFWNTSMDVIRCESLDCTTLEFPTPPQAWPVPQSFDPNYKTTWEVDTAIDWLDDREDPWFLWMAFQSPHTPLQLPPEHLVDDKLVEHVKDLLGDYEPGFWASINGDPDVAKAVFHAMVSSLDTEIARLLDQIDLENTYVIFIGDNGTITAVAEPELIPDGHGKGSQYQGGLQVPFIVSGPGIRSGSRTAALTHSGDVYSTILDMAGVEIEMTGRPVPALETAEIDGLSLMPLLTEGDETLYGRDYVLNTRAIYSWMNPVFFSGAGFIPSSEGEAIRDERYKLHRQTIVNDETGFMCVEDPQPSAENPVPCDMTERVKSFQLYDLTNDPLELNDLLLDGEENLTDIQREAFHRLYEAMVEIAY